MTSPASLMSDLSRCHFEDAFRRAATTNLVRSPNDSISIEPLKSQETSRVPDSRLVIITISSFAFRLLTLFQVVDNPAMRAYFGGAAAARIDETFAEVANLCCGALNRDLSQSFPHLAMSIPYSLSSRSLRFLDVLHPQFLSGHSICIDSQIHVEATLCMCCTAAVHLGASVKRPDEEAGVLQFLS